MAYFTAPEEPLDFIHDLLEVKGGELGLGYVAYGDEDKLPRYPAVKVVAGPMQKELHATHQFRNIFTVDLWVYHGNLRKSHAQRSKDDLLLVTAIRTLLHSNMTLGGGIVHGWVFQEIPFAGVPRAKASPVVGTRMMWQGQAIESFGAV